MYIYNDDEIELPKVEDTEECGFKMPEKELYYNDWNDEHTYKDGTMERPTSKDPESCGITTIKKGMYYNNWNDDYKFTDVKNSDESDRIDKTNVKCQISDMLKPIYKNPRNDGDINKKNDRKAITVDDPYNEDFPDPFKKDAEENPDEPVPPSNNDDKEKEKEKDDPRPPIVEDKEPEKRLLMNYK